MRVDRDAEQPLGDEDDAAVDRVRGQGTALEPEPEAIAPLGRPEARPHPVEIEGDRAIHHDGWIASTTPPAGPWLLGLGKLPNVLDGYNWELYDLTKDFSQADDLAAKEPASSRSCRDLFLVEAAKYGVFPLDNRVATRFGQQPSATAGRDTFTYTGELSGLPPSAAPSPLGRSYSITAEVEVPAGGGEGVINTLGGRFGGYGLYLLKGKPVFTYNLLALERFRWEGADALTPGKHTIVFDFTYAGSGFGKGGTGVLSIDGAEVARQAIPDSIPFIATIDKFFDVGVDTRTPIDDKDYQVPFRFTGTLNKLTVKVGPPQV